MNWFLLSIIAALFWGFENFLYKTSARRNYNSAKITAIFGITVTVLSVILFLVSGEKLVNPRYLLFIGFLNAVAFFISLITRFEALKTGPFSIVGAITNFSLLITLSLAIFIYKERPTVKHIFGIVLSFIALFLFKL